MKNLIILITLLTISTSTIYPQTLVRKSGVEMSYVVQYENTINKYGCEFDQYKIIGYVQNNSGRRIHWNWGSINFGGVICYNTQYVGGEVKVKSSTDQTLHFSSFFDMDSGDLHKASIYILVHDGQNVPDPGWDWSWEFK